MSRSTTRSIGTGTMNPIPRRLGLDGPLNSAGAADAAGARLARLGVKRCGSQVAQASGNGALEPAISDHIGEWVVVSFV
jgi:hypothetical protein